MKSARMARQNAPMPYPENSIPWWKKLYQLIPLKVMLVLVIWCTLVKEHYPFSHFPMYSKFKTTTYYVYLADKDNKPIPMLKVTGMLTSLLKKINDHELRRHKKQIGKRIADFSWEDRRGPGEATLQFVFKNMSSGAKQQVAPLRPIRLHHVNLQLIDGIIVETDKEIAREEDALAGLIRGQKGDQP